LSTLYIAEIDMLGIDSQGNTIMAGVRPLLVPAYSIAITGGQNLSPIFASTTRFLEMHCDVVCSFDVDVNPTAITTAERLGAGERIFYPLRPNVANLRLAVTSNT
jgi:hypothetical protein